MGISTFPAASSSATALPYGATTALFAGQSTSGTYTYTTSIAAGTYAVGVDSLGSTVDNYVVSTTTGSQSLTIPNGGRKYITLSSAVSDLTFTPQGVLPNTTTGTKYFSLLQTGSGYGIACNNSKYVAATNQTDGIETSSDGFSWTVATTNGYRAGANQNVWYNSTVGNWTVVGAGSVHTSTDTVTWTNKDIGGGFLGTGGTSSASPGGLYQGVLSNNYYYALGGRGHYSVSTNGTTWQHLTGMYITGGIIRGGAFGNNTFIAAGDSGTAALLSTTEAWSYRYPGWGTTIYAATYGNGLFVAAGHLGNLSTSTDGNVWTLKTSGFGSTIIRGLEYGNGIYVAVGDTGQLRTSTDATTWTTRTSNFGSTQINAVAYGGTVYVAVGNAGTLTSSTDATTWTARTSQFGSSNINAVAYGNGIFVAVGAGGRTTTSTNGTTWTAQTSGTTSILYAVKYHNTRWVATGASGVIRTSTDAVTWAAATQTNAMPSANINMLVSNGTNKLWAGGASGILTLSTDGITFDVRNSTSPFYNESLYSVNIIGGTYYAFGNSKRYSSTDGITWNPTSVSYTSGNINSYVVYNGTNYVARSTTNNYTMAYSTNGLTWTDGTSLSSATYVISGYKMFGTTLVVWGYDSSNAPIIANTTSATIASWANQGVITTGTYAIDTAFNITDISAVASGYIALGNYKYPIYAANFTNTSWAAKNTQAAGIQSAVGNNIIVTPFDGEVCTVNTSTNSKTTQDITSSTGRGVAYNPDNTIFVATFSSTIYSSTNGVSFTTTSSTPAAGSQWKLAYKNGQFYAASPGTGSAASLCAIYYGGTNGTSWGTVSAQTSTISTTAITYGIGAATGTDSRVISCCNEGYLGVISDYSDAIGYTQVPGCSQTTFRSATGGNGILLATGNNNTIARWAPGQTGWARVGSPFNSTADIRGVAYSNGVFAAVSTAGTFATSTDGVTWTTRTIPSGYLYSTYYDIQPFGNGDFVITGDGIVWKTTKVDAPSAYQFYQTTFSALA